MMGEKYERMRKGKGKGKEKTQGKMIVQRMRLSKAYWMYLSPFRKGSIIDVMASETQIHGGEMRRFK
jgi:hypothetical protein